MSVFQGALQSILKTILDEQIQHEKKGEYVEAEKCRLKYENQKDRLHKKHLAEMNAKHKQERDDLNKAKEDEISRFTKLYEDQMKEFQTKSNQLEKQMQDKHKKDYDCTKDQLDKTLPIKVKESSELLNLRKMEAHMAKQKNYPEAKKIQDQISKMLACQTQAWNQNRQGKLDNSLNILKNKQKTELNNFQKRVKTTKAERNKEKDIKVEEICQKYQNLMRDLKVVQEREVLGFKGQLKSLGGTASSSPAKTRTHIH